jgi:O-succinylbenzoic acid--CoA ligase
MTAVAADQLWLPARAELSPDATAVLDDDTTLSWRALSERSEMIAGGLFGHPVSRGDRVGILCAPGCDFAAVVHAVQSIGAISVPLPLRATAVELSDIIARLGIRTIVTDEANEYRAVTGTVGIAIDTLRDAGARRSHAAYDSRTTHSILFTSGTATKPKGVVLTNDNFYRSALASCHRLDVDDRDVWLAAMPMNHIGGLSILLRSAIVGFSVVLRSTFDARDFDRCVREHEVSIASMVPTMLARCLEHVERNAYPSTFRCALIGGAGLGPTLLERAQRAGIPIATTYGLTETTSQVTTSQPGSAAHTARGVVHAGAALDGTLVSIADTDAHGVGDIVVEGPQIMAGYYGDNAATASVMRNATLRTGDRGRIDSDGNLEVLGRSDEVIITGGENVSPAEVEEVLIAYASVVDAGVYGVEDVEWGQAVVAAVVVNDQATKPNDLKDWCRERLASHKIPKRIHFVEALPRTGSGKLRRKRLGELPEARRQGFVASPRGVTES